MRQHPKPITRATIKEAERLGLGKLLPGDLLYGFQYDPDGKILFYNNRVVFEKGKWASIISEPEKEMTMEYYITKWIEDKRFSTVYSLSAFLEENNLIITKAPSNA